jgi:hypothetical protein
MACYACARGFTDECDCPPPSKQASFGPEKKKKGKKAKPPVGPGSSRRKELITTSAGRKRAALEYEIIKGAPCEWRMRKNCGGGLHPIVGCATGTQENRHHGPDKDTSNNARNNMHIICSSCHNTWHAANDEYYDRDVYRELPHRPVEATIKDIIKAGRTK